ncbi:MAG: hypothetical protein Q6L68_12085, partial [Thermostichus sp. DG02_5_bins_236]
GSTLAATQMAAERCCQRMIQDPFVVNGQALPVQLHFGAASLMENDDPRGVTLLRRAAQAMRDSRNLHSSVVTIPNPILAPEELLNRLKKLETENENLRQDLKNRLTQLQDLRTQNLQLKEKIQSPSLELPPPPQGFLTHERPQLTSRKPIQRRLKRKIRRRPFQKRDWSFSNKALRRI